MLSKTRTTLSTHRIAAANLLHAKPISSLKVQWRRDPSLDQAIELDKPYKLCSRVVNEVLNEPHHKLPLHHFEARRRRLRLRLKASTFLSQNPNLFLVFPEKLKLKPKSQPIPFIKPSDKLLNFLDEQRRIQNKNHIFIVEKLCKLLMIAKNNVVSVEKLNECKREFGFPDDFMETLVPKHPEYFRVVKGLTKGKSYLELVEWNPEFAKSVITRRAEEETRLTGVRVRPNFDVRLPRWCVLKKEMREWVRDWMEMEYVSPYEDVSRLDQASREMEKRNVGVFHEVLSLSLLKRMALPILGKFCEEYRFSNAFGNVITRHPGLFYVSLKGGIKTAVLREAYEGDKLVDRDPLLEIKDKFVELLEEGWRGSAENLKSQREEAKAMAVTTMNKGITGQLVNVLNRLGCVRFHCAL